MTGADILRAGEWIRLLVELGLEVYRAVEEGDDSKMVGDIFRERVKDTDKVLELEEAAREHFRKK